MMTKPGTVQPGSAEFDAFRSRQRLRIPEELREGAPVPETWPDSAESWEEYAAAAREHLKLKAEYDFAYRIAVLGYYPDELKGNLRHGAEIKLATGRVFRHRPAYDGATMKRARELKHQLAHDRAPLAPILMGDLEAIGQGRHVGSDKRVAIVMGAAEGALSQHHTERQATTREEAARPVLTVHRPFRAIAGKKYAPGTYRITQVEVDGLRLWQERMQEQQRQHDWDAPAGYSRDSWPPFSLETPRLDD